MVCVYCFIGAYLFYFSTKLDIAVIFLRLIRNITAECYNSGFEDRQLSFLLRFNEVLELVQRKQIYDGTSC